jgi:hypothetical protein
VTRLRLIAAFAAIACVLTLGRPADAATARTNYMERCGGCHGLEGHSASKLVPQLKDRAGYFLCTQEGRNYVARLPNIVFSNLGNEDLAALLNFVMFEIGGGSAPVNAVGFSAAEMGRSRQDPLTTVNLLTFRERVVSNLISGCGAPRSMTEYRPPRSLSPADHAAY